MYIWCLEHMNELNTEMYSATEQVEHINVHLVSRTTEQVKHRNVYLVPGTAEQVKYRYVHLVSRAPDQAKHRNVHIVSRITEQIKYRYVHLVNWIDIVIFDVYCIDLYALHELQEVDLQVKMKW